MVAMLATSVHNQATLPILLIRGLSGIAQNEGRLESRWPVQHGCIAWTKPRADVHLDLCAGTEGTTFAAVDIRSLLSNSRARHVSTGTNIGERISTLAALEVEVIAGNQGSRHPVHAWLWVKVSSTWPMPHAIVCRALTPYCALQTHF